MPMVILSQCLILMKLKLSKSMQMQLYRNGKLSPKNFQTSHRQLPQIKGKPITYGCCSPLMLFTMTNTLLVQSYSHTISVFPAPTTQTTSTTLASGLLPTLKKVASTMPSHPQLLLVIIHNGGAFSRPWVRSTK